MGKVLFLPLRRIEPLVLHLHPRIWFHSFPHQLTLGSRSKTILLILVLYSDVALVPVSRRGVKAIIEGGQCLFAAFMIPEIKNLLLEEIDFVSKLLVFVDEPRNFLGHFASFVVAGSHSVKIWPIRMTVGSMALFRVEDIRLFLNIDLKLWIMNFFLWIIFQQIGTKIDFRLIKPWCYAGTEFNWN